MSARTHTALRTRTILAALAAAAMVVVGCGGDDDAADSTSTTESADTETTETETTEPDTTDSPDGGSAGFSSEDCQQLAEAFDQSELGATLDGTTDPTPQLEEVARYLEEAATEVPDAVVGDVEVLADVYGQLAAASADVNWEGLTSGDPAAAAGAAEIGQIYAANPEFVTAAQNLSVWAAENCTPTS